MSKISVKEVEAQSVLVKSKLPDADYVVNPYTGCIFGCLYCYASFMGRFVGEPVTSWGDYLYVKTNAVEVFRKELAALRRTGQAPSIFLSPVTDPYQGVEAKYKLSRGILEVLSEEPYPGVVSILTKSPLVLRDTDVLRKLPRAEVGMTITTTDDNVSKFLEVRAPVATRRIAALKELHAQGLTTYAFVGPLLPHFRHDPAALDALFAELADASVGSVYVEHINLKPYIRERLFPLLESEPESIREEYRGAIKPAHRQALDEVVARLLEKHHLRLRLSEVLYHNERK